jgi:transaldolase
MIYSHFRGVPINVTLLFSREHYIAELAARLQNQGADSFVKSWNDLMGVIAAKSASLGQATGQNSGGEKNLSQEAGRDEG